MIVEGTSLSNSWNCGKIIIINYEIWKFKNLILNLEVFVLLLLRKGFYKTTKNKFIYSLVGIAVQICAGHFLKMIEEEKGLIIKDHMILKKVINTYINY